MLQWRPTFQEYYVFRDIQVKHEKLQKWLINLKKKKKSKRILLIIIVIARHIIPFVESSIRINQTVFEKLYTLQYRLYPISDFLNCIENKSIQFTARFSLLLSPFRCDNFKFDQATLLYYILDIILTSRITRTIISLSRNSSEESSKNTKF